MATAIPPLTPDQRHAVATRYDRALQHLGAALPEQALPLLLECCGIDPANRSYRQLLRHVQWELRRKQPVPAWAAWMSTWRARRRMRKALQAGLWLEAVALAEDVLTVDPKNAEAHGALATAFETLGWIDQAVICLELARIAVQPETTFDGELARLYQQRGNFTQAGQLTMPPAGDDLDTFRKDLAITENKLREQPNSADLHQIRMRLVHEIEARELTLLQERADRFPGELQYRFELGVRLLKAGQFEAALSAFEQARTDERWRWRGLVYAAYCHLNRRQWARAKPLLEEALPLIPEAEMMRKEVQSLLDRDGWPIMRP
jgi:tetratricopeptide (TPR) repeat protein